MKLKRDPNILKKAKLHKTINRKRQARHPLDDSALDAAVKNVKKIIENKKSEVKHTQRRTKNLSLPSVKKNWVFKPKYGLVYVGHLPHGFYEAQLKHYFGQFGEVLRVRVARSKKTGKSKGCAYVEFKQKAIAKIAAESMNNYLMSGRLLKAKYIAPHKQHMGFFFGKNWTSTKFPKLHERKKTIKKINSEISEESHEKFVNRSVKKLNALEQELKKKGIVLNLSGLVSSERNK